MCTDRGGEKKEHHLSIRKATSFPSSPSFLGISEPNDGQRYSLSAGEMRFSSRPNTHGRLLIMLVPPSALLLFSWSGTCLASPNPNRNHDSNCKTDFESVQWGDIPCSNYGWIRWGMQNPDVHSGSGHPLSKIPSFSLQLPGRKARSNSWWWAVMLFWHPCCCIAEWIIDGAWKQKAFDLFSYYGTVLKMLMKLSWFIGTKLEMEQTG